MSEKLKGVLVKVGEEINEIEEYTMETGDLQEFYKILNCQTITVVTRKIKGKEYDIVCDDEGLLKGEVTPTFVTYEDNSHNKVIEYLVGNLFICHHDDEGGFTDIKQGEIHEIMLTTAMEILPGNKLVFPVIVGTI